MKAKDIIQLSKGTKEKALQTAKGLIKKDALKGQFQNGKEGIKYSTEGDSFTYKDYKKNNMRKFGRGPNKIGSGEKLNAYKGRSTDTETGFVNANLTGETLRRITTKPGGRGKIGKLVFERGEVVLGLRKEKGADIYDLRNENRTKISKIIEQDLARRAEKWMAEDKTIRIG